MKKETGLQIAFANWLMAKDVLFTASMLGVNLPVRYAVMRKRMGVRAGTPDIQIFEPRGRYAGLFIELKSDTGNTKDELQIWWRDELNKRGYLALIMPKLDSIMGYKWLTDTVEKYLSGQM
jgi:hypothetical protein